MMSILGHGGNALREIPLKRQNETL